MPTTVLGFLGVLLCSLAITSEVTPQTDFDIKGTLITSTTTVPSEMGGFTPEAPVTDHMKKICIEVQSDIEKAVGTNFPLYIPISFRRQIVSGTNYLVKVFVGQHVCVHAMIYHTLPCNGGKLTVTGIQFPKTITDPLVPF